MRVILMSGYDETLEVARQDGFGFLPKPFGADELASAMMKSLSPGPTEG